MKKAINLSLVLSENLGFYNHEIHKLDETLLMIFQIHSESEDAREANDIYDAIKEEGS